jgi:replicative superfamily II helicase
MGQLGCRYVAGVDILLTTPEKFDSITRKNKDRGGMSFFGDCALVMIEEVHLLGDERGGALEAVVSRLKVLSEKPSLRAHPLGSVRFVACSATVPNLADVGKWLQAGSEKRRKRRCVDVSTPPPPLQPAPHHTHTAVYPPAPPRYFPFPRTLKLVVL